MKFKSAILVCICFFLAGWKSHYVPMEKAPEQMASDILEKLSSLPSLEIEPSVHARGMFYLHRFQLRLETFLRFGISRVLSLRVAPVVELEFWRNAPEGFEDVPD